MTSLVMLNDAKHPHTGFLACARNDIAGHAERRKASMHWIPRCARNDITGHAERRKASMQ
jgi:hypothetical protein